MRVLVVVLALVMTACASAAGVEAAGTYPAGEEQPEGRAVTPAGRDGMEDVHAITWERTSGKGRKLTIHWWSGVEPCHVLADVEVTETRKQVTVTLYEGTTDPDAACIQTIEPLRTTVKLARPLGGRTVVDGAQR